MNPEAWFSESGVCGSCLAWRPSEATSEDTVAPGKCLLRPELRRVPASLGKCSKYQQRGEFKLEAKRSPRSSTRRKAAPVVVKRVNDQGELVDVTPPPKTRRSPPRTMGPSDATYTPAPEPVYRDFPPTHAPATVDMGGWTGPLIESVLAELMGEEIPGRTREMHSKYRQGGQVVATDQEGKTRSMAAHIFFAKLERLAKSIDAIEEAVETHDRLDDSDDLVSYIHKIRGSLTTFNLLFAERDDYFSGKA